MSTEANVKPIRIMLKTNIKDQKEDTPFTKALLSHPDYPGLSDTEGFNEFPYICDNVYIPISLNSASYFERVQFFFDKDKFRSLTSDSQVGADNERSLILIENVKTMLNLLFLTAIPVSGNVKDSFKANIDNGVGSWIPNLKFNKESAMEFLNTYYFSYLKIGGSEYTVNRIVWLNDVINNPDYSKLFSDFETFNTWSIGILNKLLADKKRLYRDILDTCAYEFRNLIDSTPRKITSYTGTAFIEGYNAIDKLKTEIQIRNAPMPPPSTRSGRQFVDVNREKKYTEKELEELDTQIIRKLAHAAYLIKFPKKSIDIADDGIKISENDVENINNTYDRYNPSTKNTLIEKIKELDDEHNKIQKQIDDLNIERMNALIEVIVEDKGNRFSPALQRLVRDLMRLITKNNDEIVRVVRQIIYNKTDEKPLPSKYAYLNEIFEKMSKFTAEKRFLLPNETNYESYTQELIDNYANRADDAKSKMIDFIDKGISPLKKSGKFVKYDSDNFYIGVVEFRNDDPKLPTYEIVVQCDVFGGILDATNIRSARCIFKDQRLTKQFVNMRRNIKVNKLKVIPGPYFDLKDIKPEPKPKETVKQRPVPVKGGRRTLKRRNFKRR
jgi:hypothetical protein